MAVKIYPIEKIRSIVKWANWQDEHINYRIKSIKDFEVIYDFLIKSDYESLETLRDEEPKAYNILCKKLGYELL